MKTVASAIVALSVLASHASAQSYSYSAPSQNQDSTRGQ